MDSEFNTDQETGKWQNLYEESNPGSLKGCMNKDVNYYAGYK